MLDERWNFRGILPYRYQMYVVLHDRKRKHLKGIKEKVMIRLS
jgi:hypothetical protein